MTTRRAVTRVRLPFLSVHSMVCASTNEPRLFLYSTPAYRRTLVLYGVEHLEAELKDLIRHDRFDDLGEVLDDDLIDALVPTGTLADLPAILLERFNGLAQGILLSVPVDPELDEPLALAIAELQAA